MRKWEGGGVARGTWLKYSQTITHQRGSVHTQLTPLWSRTAHWCGPCQMLLTYAGHCARHTCLAHGCTLKKPLTPWIRVVCLVLLKGRGTWIFREQYSCGQVFRPLSGKNGCVSSSSHACDLHGAPLQHVSFPWSVWRWPFAFSQWAGSGAVLHPAKTGAWWRSHV